MENNFSLNDELFFIYGTLKKGHRNHHMFDRFAKFQGDVQTIFKYPMFDIGDGFPYLQNNVGEGNIILGELYQIDKRFHSKIDYFEAVPTLYKRGEIKVLTEDNEILKVNVYFKSKELLIEDLNLMNEWR